MKNTTTGGVAFVLGVFAMLQLSALQAVAGEPESGGFLEGNGLAEAVGKLAAKMKTPVRVFNIEIQATTIRMQVQDPGAPTHVDEYRYTRPSGVLALLGGSISGPKAVELNLINPRLEENLFDLTAVNFNAAPETLREALRRTGVEKGTVGSITIRRQVLLNASGPVEWEIYVRGPRESASAAADAQGKIVRVDVSGTTRAQTLDLTQGGEPLDEAIRQITAQFGSGPVFKQFRFETKTLGFSIRDPKNPAQAAHFYYSMNGIQKSLEFNIGPPRVEKVDEGELFGSGDVDWSRLPELKKLAVEKVAIPGGHVGTIEILRPKTATGYKPPHWKFTITVGLFAGESGTAEFDAKSGTLGQVIPPESRRKKVDHLEPEMVNRMIAAARSELGANIAFLTIFIAKGGGTMSIQTADHPDEIRRYGFDDLAGLHFLETTRDPRTKGPPETWRTSLAEVEGVLPKLPALYQKARERLQLPQGSIERVTVNRADVFYPNNKKALLEIRVEVPGDSGRVIYDFNGVEFDAVTPNSYSDSEKTAPNLKPLGITDTTPARVKKLTALLETFIALLDKESNTPWGKMRKGDQDKLRTLPREEYRKWLKVRREMLDCADKITKLFAERKPPADAIAATADIDKPNTRAYWEAQRALEDVSCRQWKIYDDNWDDWVAHGFPKVETDYKPWHKEVVRLRAEITAAQKRVDEL
jgi:hypothetical protein